MWRQPPRLSREGEASGPKMINRDLSLLSRDAVILSGAVTKQSEVAAESKDACSDAAPPAHAGNFHPEY
ncbi:MAG: hypothetical protein ABSG34_15790 [Candidatus Sulfotelmatobacter sp.]